MAKKRPASLTVFGVLNCVFGGLGLLCNLFNAVLLAIGPMLQQMQAQQGAGGINSNDLQKHLEANVPGYVAFQWGQAGISLMLSVVLIVAGIGLLRMSPVGRWMSVAYSLVIIVIQLSVMVYNIGFIGPAVDEWLKQQRVQVPMPSWTFTGASVGGACLGMTYAIVLLVFMLLPGTARAMRGEGPPEPRADDDYYDPDFDRKRRDLPTET